MKTRMIGFSLDPRDCRSWEVLHTLGYLPVISDTLREYILGWLRNATLYNDSSPPEVLDTRLLQELGRIRGVYMELSANQGEGVVYSVKLVGALRTCITATQFSYRSEPEVMIEFPNDDPVLIERCAEGLRVPKDAFAFERNCDGRESVRYETEHGVVKVIYSA